MLKAKKIAENVYWVGAKDYDVRSFHGYKTGRGATYNAYLITGEKNVLIDSVKKTFADEMIQRISSVTNVENIDIIISNHAEFDHSGSIKTIADISGATVIATAAGAKTLKNLYGEMNFKTVAAGETLGIGEFEFSFLPTPMVHWPDNMVTFEKKNKILFSNDAFGQHLAVSGIFDTEISLEISLYEAEKYYANIVMPYAPQVKKALDAAKSLRPEIIAPSHGVVWTKHIGDIFALYDRMTAGEKKNKAVITYDTMWGNTEIIAKQIGAKFEEICDDVIYANLQTVDRSDLMADIAECKYLCVGSPTLNSTMMPSVAAFLNYVTGLKPPALNYVAFGSYGWGGGAIKQICEILDKAGYTKLGEAGAIYKPETLNLKFIDDLK